MSLTPSRRCLLLALGSIVSLAVVPAHAKDAAEAQRIVDKARIAFADVVAAKDHQALRDGLKSANGVLIFPSVLKGGFVVGGSGGTGVLLVRGDNNAWSEPAFYTIGALSVGLLAGGQSAEVVILVNSQKAIDRLLTSSLKLGGDASIAVGPRGSGKASNITADFVSYARTKGAYAGLSVEGSVLDVRDSLNHAYYGKAATPVEILVKHTASSKHSQPLRSAVAAKAR